MNKNNSNFDLSDYEKALMNRNVLWEDVHASFAKPIYLYKYRRFRSKYWKNRYWKDYVVGKLRMNTVNYFDDLDEVNPYFTYSELDKAIFEAQQDGLLDCRFDTKTKEQRYNICCELSKWVESYRSNFRIGCLCSSFPSKEMLERYSDREKGFCIRYVVDKSEVLKKMVYPVLYTDEKFSLCKSAIIVWLSEKQAKKECKELNVFWREHKEIYNRLNKNWYIPIFRKKKKFEFENEYRIVLSTNEGSNGMNSINYIDDTGDLNLYQSVDAIFLGRNFKKNKYSDFLLKKIKKIIGKSDIKLYRMKKWHGKYEYFEV